MNDFINGVEVPELSQEQMNELVRRRAHGGHSVSQNGDSFDAYKMKVAIDLVGKEMQAAALEAQVNALLNPSL